MGFLLDFLDSHTSIDWNGDGKIDSWDDVLEVAMLTQMLDDDAREERIRKIVDAIVRRGTCHIGNKEFEELCRQEGLRAEDFDQSDIDEIQRRLLRYSWVSKLSDSSSIIATAMLEQWSAIRS